MPKTLYLVRHATTSPGTLPLADLQRPLSDAGRQSAAALGRYLARTGARPDLVLCSTAARANETLALAIAEWPINAPVDERPSLYLASAETLLNEVRALDDGLESAMLMGHNPGMAEFAAALQPAQRSNPLATFPTATVAVFTLAIGRWRDAAPGRGRLGAIMTPREFETAPSRG